MPLRLLWQPGVAHDADVATIYLDLQVVSTEVAVFSDDAVVYLDIQPGSIFLQVDYLLQIMGIQRRWPYEYAGKRWTVYDAQRRWVLAQAEQRWSVLASALRWVILQTRRTLWRF